MSDIVVKKSRHRHSANLGGGVAMGALEETPQAASTASQGKRKKYARSAPHPDRQKLILEAARAFGEAGFTAKEMSAAVKGKLRHEAVKETLQYLCRTGELRAQGSTGLRRFHASPRLTSAELDQWIRDQGIEP